MAVRQRMVAAASRILGTTTSMATSSSTRPKPRTSKKLYSIATRTLAVAVLWSPSQHTPRLAHAFVEGPLRWDSPIPNNRRRRQRENWQSYASMRSFRSMADENASLTTTTIKSSLVESTSHLPRLFVQGDETTEPVPLRKKALVPLTADQEHYLLDVMRITNPKRWGGKTNDDNDYTSCLRIFNGSDGEWLAKVDAPPSQSKKRQRKTHSGGTLVECLEELRPQQQEEQQQLSNSKIELCFGYIRDKQRRRWVFEKGTELGVESFQILETDFCHKDAYKKKDLLWEEEREKHEKHVIEAAEQCERLTVPSIAPEVWTVDTIATELSDSKCSNNNDLWLVCRERSEASPPILSVLAEATNPTNDKDAMKAATIRVLVGPEGGWSPRELEVFSSLEGIRFVSLGSSVLRAETASIAAVASIQMHRETFS